MTRLLDALICILICSGSASGAQGRGQSSFEWSKTMSAGSTVVIRNGDGFIHAGESISGRVEVRATKIGGSRASASDVTFDVNESRDGVTICTRYDPRRPCGDRGRS